MKLYNQHLTREMRTPGFHQLLFLFSRFIIPFFSPFTSVPLTGMHTYFSMLCNNSVAATANAVPINSVLHLKLGTVYLYRSFNARVSLGELWLVVSFFLCPRAFSSMLYFGAFRWKLFLDFFLSAQEGSFRRSHKDLCTPLFWLPASVGIDVNICARRRSGNQRDQFTLCSCTDSNLHSHWWIRHLA